MYTIGIIYILMLQSEFKDIRVQSTLVSSSGPKVGWDIAVAKQTVRPHHWLN